MKVAYNEIDEFCCAWLSNLMDAGHISPGVILNRSIEDLVPAELDPFDLVHFFAGIGIWDLAIRKAGWQPRGKTWTASCPCQPFSAAGKRAGADDPRDLWPALYHLARVCRPDTLVGEQVASPDGLAWLEGVQASMEREGYAVGAVDTCAAGFADAQGDEGFHIRQRLYWGARRLCDADNARPQGRIIGRDSADQRAVGPSGLARAVGSERVADADQQVQGGRRVFRPGESVGPGSGSALERPAGLRTDSAAPGGVADALLTGRPQGRPESGRGSVARSGAVDWLPCRDGKSRPVESGTFPLAHEDTQRVGRLRAYGNALDAAQAEGFVRAWMECAP